MCLENGTRDFKREYRAMNHGTFSVDAKGAGKGERLSHDTMIQSLSNPPERTPGYEARNFCFRWPNKY